MLDQFVVGMLILFASGGFLNSPVVVTRKTKRSSFSGSRKKSVTFGCLLAGTSGRGYNQSGKNKTRTSMEYTTYSDCGHFPLRPLTVAASQQQ